MKRETQLKVQAYLDNELSPGEARKVSEWISTEAELRDLYTELKQTRESLVANEPEAKLDDSREFYWSKIERAIAASSRDHEARTNSERPWWMRMLAPVAGMAAIFAILVAVVDRGGTSIAPSPSVSTTVASASAPLHEFEQTSDVSTITFRSEAEGVTVVWLSTQ